MKRTLTLMLALVMVLSVFAGFAQAEGGWTCTSCGKENEISSNFCGGCGEKRQVTNIGWVCFNCAKENGNEAVFCGECGADKNAFAWSVQPGRIIKFGHYEQDNDLRSSDEPINWIVLDVDTATETALVLSEKILESRPYQSGDKKTKYVYWADSEIRHWLNNEFMNTAFTMGEQQFIAWTTNSTEPVNGFSGGPDCDDQIFLLSRNEVSRYYPGETPLDIVYNKRPWQTKYNLDRCAVATPYARAQGCYKFDQGLSYEGMERFEGYSYWWLRNPGESDNMASLVYCEGRLGNYFGVSDGERGIRPAMWIKLNPSGEESAWRCRLCSKDNATGDNFCTKCGAQR